MEIRRSILSETFEEIRTVEAAVDSLTDFLDGSPSGASALDNGKFAVDLLEHNYSKGAEMLDMSLDYIESQWKEIIQSEAMEYEVYRFCSSCRALYEKIDRLDDSVCRNDALGAAVLDDCWLARRYLVSMMHWISRAAFVLEYADENFRDRRGELGAFYGAAKACRPFFAGVSDEDLRDLVMDGKPLAGRPVWRGTRCEGTLMGQELGLSCADMNHSFLFLNEKKMPRPLKYSSDTVNNDRMFYKIAGALDFLKRAKELTKKRPQSAKGAGESWRS